MLLRAIGAGLPAAVAVALSPFPLIGIVLVLAGPHGRRSGPCFAIGWMVGLSGVTVLTAVVLGGAEDPESTTAAIADWGRVVAGAELIVMGLRKWRTRPQRGEVIASVGWMASLDTVSPSRALPLGLGLAAANPKNFVLSAAAAASIMESGVEGTQLAVAVALFVLVGSASVVGAVMIRLVGGARGASILEGVREFMVANSAVITMFVLVVLGAKVLGDGLSGLGR